MNDQFDSYSNQQELNTRNSQIKEELEKYLYQWKWFVLSVFLCIIGALVYLRYSTETYEAVATILIKDNLKSGISTELEAFKDLGIIGGNSSNNPDNEIEILRSRRVIGNVVDSLDLTTYYYLEGRIIVSEAYKQSNPIKLTFIQRDSFLLRKDTLLVLKPLNENEFELYSENEESKAQYTYDEIITSEIGNFRIVRNNGFRKKEFPEKVMIQIQPRYRLIDRYRNRIQIELVNKNSSVLILTLEDFVREKAEDVLNEIVKQYNLDAIRDKSQVSEKTREFIDDRLRSVGKELAIIDDEVKNFKSDKKFTGLPVEASLILEAVSKNNEQLVILKTQLTLAKWIKNQLLKESAKNDVLPSSLGFEDQSVVESIKEYNTLILQRNKIQANAGKLNPVLKQLDVQITSLKSSLLASLGNVQRSIELQLLELQAEEKKVTSRVSSIPEKERGFIDISRQQEIITEFYSYLLKKKEETDLSLAVTVSNAKIIDTAYSSKIPVSPKRGVIYLAAIILGFIIPFVIIYIKELLDTKVHSKQDIENTLSIPFLGDIPTNTSKEKVVTGSDVRSSAAEAFRLIQTNLDFMLTNNRKQSKSIFITSTTSGEGKSFISINIAATLALSGKKVLLIEMDLRAPKIVQYLDIPERKGVTKYITDDLLTVEDIIFTIPQVPGLDIMSSGVVPPNPAELLMTKRVENLFTMVKEDYDFVIVDTAPVNLVTDTLLISKYADMFIYTIRANYLDKRLLGVPKNLYQEKRLPNMAVVLNDTDPKKSYGYGYGGFGYGYVVVEKPWYKKIFDRS